MAHGNAAATGPHDANRAAPATTRADMAGPERTAIETADEVESLGILLGPALHDACTRLGDIEWFRSPWQRSGAATGRTWWRLPSNEVVPAIAKVPVNFREWKWTTELGSADPFMWDRDEERCRPVPRVLASGIELGGYDVAWLVVERIPGEPISHDLRAETVRLMLRAAADFHEQAAGVRAPTASDRPTPPRWRHLVTRAIEAVEHNHVPRRREWREALRVVDRHLVRLVEAWAERPTDTWCHGDLHPGNAMLRPSRGDGGPCCALIDLGLIHAGSWVEDAVYLERLYWGREEMLGGLNPVRELARARAARGLSNGEAFERLASLRRVLMAATSPAFLNSEGDPRYLNRALDHLYDQIPKIMPMTRVSGRQTADAAALAPLSGSGPG